MSNFFDARFEQNSINHGLAQQQKISGLTILWFFFNKATSTPDPIYGEGGRRWDGPFPISVLEATRVEGDLGQQGEGMYPVDNLILKMSYQQATDEGLLPPVDETYDHLRDRFIFDHEVWSPSRINVRNLLGGGGTRSTFIITATQIKDDEMVDDPDFIAMAATPNLFP